MFDYRFIADELDAEHGIRASENRVQRLCSAHGIFSVLARKKGRRPRPDGFRVDRGRDLHGALKPARVEDVEVVHRWPGAVFVVMDLGTTQGTANASPCPLFLSPHRVTVLLCRESPTPKSAQIAAAHRGAPSS